jgi:hypothetical protein
MTDGRFSQAFDEALTLLDMFEDLEPRSALKQCASDNNISEGDELQSFVFWAEKKLYGGKNA